MTMPRLGVLVVSCVFACLACDPAPEKSRSDAGSADANVPDAADGGLAPLVKCDVTLPTKCTDTALHFDAVESIFKARCSSSCHAPGNPDGNWPLDSYQHIADWNNEIRDVISKCQMPPPAAMRTMPVAEREKILLWLRCGFPR